MIDILKAGVAVNTILLADPDVSVAVGTKIYPNVIPESKTDTKAIKYPKIVYTRVSFDRVYSKGCAASDSANVTIECWDNTYKDAVELAEKVILALDRKSGEFGGVKIRDIRILGIVEAFDEDAFVQAITLKIT